MSRSSSKRDTTTSTNTEVAPTYFAAVEGELGGEEVGDRCDQFRPVVADVAHERGDGVKRDPLDRAGPKQLVQRGRRHQRVEPGGEMFAVEDDRHALVQVARRLVGHRGND